MRLMPRLLKYLLVALLLKFPAALAADDTADRTALRLKLFGGGSLQASDDGCTMGWSAETIKQWNKQQERQQQLASYSREHFYPTAVQKRSRLLHCNVWRQKRLRHAQISISGFHRRKCNGAGNSSQDHAPLVPHQRIWPIVEDC